MISKYDFPKCPSDCFCNTDESALSLASQIKLTLAIPNTDYLNNKRQITLSNVLVLLAEFPYISTPFIFKFPHFKPRNAVPRNLKQASTEMSITHSVSNTAKFRC